MKVSSLMSKVQSQRQGNAFLYHTPGFAAAVVVYAFLFAITGVAAVPPGFFQSAIPGLVGWWPLNSTNIVDCSGNGAPATNQACVAFPGVIGGGLAFTNGASNNSGLSNYVHIAGSAALKPAALTVCAWVNISHFVQSQKVVCCPYRTNNSWSAPYVAYCLNTDEQGNRHPSFAVAIAGNLCELTTGATLTTNTWYHLAGTYNGTNMVTYVNGVVNATTNLSGAIDYSQAGDLVFGCDSPYESGETEGFSGVLDDVRIYNRALTAPEIGRLYGGGYGTGN